MIYYVAQGSTKIIKTNSDNRYSNETDKGRQGKYIYLILLRRDGLGQSRQIHVLKFVSRRRTKVVEANTGT